MSADQLAQKLDILIRLQAYSITAAMSSQKEKILFLGRAGFMPRDIAEILGTTSNTVNVALSTARKAGIIKGKKSGLDHLGDKSGEQDQE